VENLVTEVLLRLAKAAIAGVLALVAWFVVTVGLGATPSVELALLCWLSGAAFVLLVETSPI
jgi:hypothetical protein